MKRAVKGSLVVLSLFVIVHCKPVQKPKDPQQDTAKEEWRKDDDPGYVRYLKQVIEILEEDEHFSKKLENVTEEDIRSGKIAEEIDFANHNVRTKLDELKRKEVEYQIQLLRKQRDVRNGIHREYWNPMNDRENPNTFEVEDLKKLLSKHHEEMDEIDKRRKDEFKKHEMDKEYKRRKHNKSLDEEKRKLEAAERNRLREKHHADAKRVNHPGSKAQLEEVWEDEDGLEKDTFDPKTFFRLHDKNGDGYLDPIELESLFVKEASKIHNKSDPDFDQRALHEEVQRMREHVVQQIDKDKDNFVSYEEFIGATSDNEYEKPTEGWEGIDDENEFTDEQFREYEKEFGEFEDEEEDDPSQPHPGNEAHQNNDATADNTAHRVPLAHTKDQEKQEHGGNVPMAHTRDQEKLEHGQRQQQTK